MAIHPTDDVDTPIIGEGEVRVAADLCESFSPFHASLARLLETAVKLRGLATESEVYGEIWDETPAIDYFFVIDADGEPVRVPHGTTLHDYAYCQGLWVGHGARFARVGARDIDMRKETEVLKPFQTVKITLVEDRGSPERRWSYPGSGFFNDEWHIALVRGYHGELTPEGCAAVGHGLLDIAIKFVEADIGVLFSPQRVAEVTGFNSVQELVLELGGARWDPNDLADQLIRCESEERRLESA